MVYFNHDETVKMQMSQNVTMSDMKIIRNYMSVCIHLVANLSLVACYEGGRCLREDLEQDPIFPKKST